MNTGRGVWRQHWVVSGVFTDASTEFEKERIHKEFSALVERKMNYFIGSRLTNLGTISIDLTPETEPA